MSSTSRPSSPPLAFTSSAQICAVSRYCLPIPRCRRSRRWQNPILIGSAACAARARPHHRDGDCDRSFHGLPRRSVAAGAVCRGAWRRNRMPRRAVAALVERARSARAARRGARGQLDDGERARREPARHRRARSSAGRGHGLAIGRIEEHQVARRRWRAAAAVASPASDRGARRLAQAARVWCKRGPRGAVASRGRSSRSARRATAPRAPWRRSRRRRRARAHPRK